MTVQDHPPVSRAPEPGLLSRALEVAGRLANDAAEVITATAGREHHTGAVQKANPFDWVTDTDRTLERHTRRVLAAEYPGMPVVGEEYGADDGAGSAPYRWVVDPVDGTANYVAGFPWYAYSLALVDAHGPVVGVIADPSRAQIYAAARGRGVRANGVPVRVRPRETAGGLVCAELSPDRAAGFTRQAAAAHVGVRVLGSAALAITQVALGHAVAAVLDGFREWDVAGAACLAAEAGALVVDGAGNADPLPTGVMIVAVPGALDDVLGWWHGT
ncbi:inositol monophosphatase family protein [Pseudonocardia sp. TRM90224]|uniref:inositol monophosphatase family protein n=1 Tax=Pseudonocardia sp. TRM90224 TaxID=2812678 RepID=UPI001E618DAF|nr:inositol monophosphatase family protein [Pseudonocardia sp. TRM90224]